MFAWTHQVQFYETDLMGIVHHSNYLRFFEEARVAWAHNKGILDYQKKESAFSLAVVETRTRHLKPAFFGDVLKVQIQAKREMAKIFFQYRILSEGPAATTVVALGMSSHAVLNLDLRPIKIPESIKQKMEKESWTETWL